jgi:hypothetical protein
MKYKSIQISIEQPCHERWDRMDATSRGAFCQSCRKEVIDFSMMTDREVVEYLSNHKTECGRFRDDQVDTKISIAQVKNGFLKWKVFLLGLLSFAAIKNIVARTPYRMPDTQSHPLLKIDTAQAPAALSDSITVHGTVQDDSAIGLRGAYAEPVDTAGYSTGISMWIETDSTGQFTMILARPNNNAPLQIRVSHWGYRTKTITLNSDAVQYLTVKFDQQAYMKMGKMMR